MKTDFSSAVATAEFSKFVGILSAVLSPHHLSGFEIAPKSGFSGTLTTNFQMFKLDLEKAEEPEIKLPISTGSLKKQESSRKTSISALLTMPKSLTVFLTTNCRKFWKRWEYHTTWPASSEICMQVKKQQLETDMEQRTGSKLGKEYVKVVYCHPAYLIYMQRTSCKMPGWMKHKLESIFLGEISITSDMQMTPPLWEKVKRNWGSSWGEWKRRVKVLNLYIKKKKNKIVSSSAFTSWVLDGETVETMTDFIFLGSKICTHEKKIRLVIGRRAMTNLDSILKNQRHYFDNKALSNQNWFFQYEWMWELDHKESWALKKWCFWTVVLEKTLESSLDCKEIQSVHPKDQSWVFIGGTDAKAETPILWPPDVKSWFIGKDPDTGKDWRWEEKGTTDEMVGWHHQLDGHEFEEALGVGGGQGSLACYSPWGHKVLDTTEQLNWRLQPR